MFLDEFIPAARKVGIISAYTDGSCVFQTTARTLRNGEHGGDGGWGVHLRAGTLATWEFKGSASNTTSNRMELQAAIEALERTPTDVPLRIFTDSTYVHNGATQWLPRWKANRWYTLGRKPGNPVKNRDLWTKLDVLMTGRVVYWAWLKGHSNHSHNSRADTLASLGRRGG